MSNLRIEGNRGLRLDCPEGSYWFRRNDLGIYSYRSSLKGKIGGEITASYRIAKIIWEFHKNEPAYMLLLMHSWIDIAFWFKEIIEFDGNIEEINGFPANRKFDPEKTLFYRVVPHNMGLVFAPPRYAVHIARIHRAINSSETWGQFRKAMPEDEYWKIAQEFEEHRDGIPDEEELFDGEYLPGWTDGDYPPWLQQEMDSILPLSLLEEYGERQTGFVSGSFWFIPESSQNDICTALGELGWSVERVQALEFH